MQSDWCQETQRIVYRAVDWQHATSSEGLMFNLHLEFERVSLHAPLQTQCSFHKSLSRSRSNSFRSVALWSSVMACKTTQLLLIHLRWSLPFDTEHRDLIIWIASPSVAVIHIKVLLDSLKHFSWKLRLIILCSLPQCIACTTGGCHGAKQVHSHSIPNKIFCDISIWPPEKTKNVSVLFGNLHLVKHGSNIPHECHWLLSEVSKNTK